MGTNRVLYPLGFQESVKPSRFYDTSSTIVVLVALQGFVQAFEDESPEASSRAKITYILCDMGWVMVIWLYYTWPIKLNERNWVEQRLALCEGFWGVLLTSMSSTLYSRIRVSTSWIWLSVSLSEREMLRAEANLRKLAGSFGPRLYLFSLYLEGPPVPLVGAFDRVLVCVEIASTRDLRLGPASWEHRSQSKGIYFMLVNVYYRGRLW